MALLGEEPRGSKKWLALLALVCPIALAGCGAQDSQTVTVTQAAQAAQPEPNPVKPQLSDSKRAERVVRRYYRAINSHAYGTAWDLLAPALQNELGGFAAWRDGYETTIETQVSELETLEATPRSALVSLRLQSTDIDECGETVEQTFSGTWSLENDGSNYLGSSFDVEKIAGRTPALDSSECDIEAEPEATPSHQEGGCDPNYTGCVPISAYDVDCDEVGEEVEVVGEDVYGLDLEEDGYACETY